MADLEEMVDLSDKQIIIPNPNKIFPRPNSLGPERVGALASNHPKADQLTRLDIGNPDSSLLPSRLKQELIDSYQKGALKTAMLLEYPAGEWQGNEELRTEIAQLYQNQTGHEVNPNNVVITAGAMHSMQLALQLLRPKICDRPAAILTPYFSCTKDQMEESLNGKRLIFPKTLDEALRAHPSLVVASSPSNPSGETIADQDLRRLRIMPTIMDETYLSMRPEGNRSSIIAHNKNTGIAIGSLTKIYGLAGVRGHGYMILPDKLVAPAIGARIRSTVHPDRLTQFAAAKMLKADRETGYQGLHSIAAAYANRLGILAEAFSKAGFTDLQGKKLTPQGAMYLGAKHEAYDNGGQLMHNLARVGIITSPGRPFGQTDMLRISASSFKPEQEAQLRQRLTAFTSLYGQGHP